MNVPAQMNAPIPGQSLTTPPGNAAWEKPPQFVDLSKACDYVFTQLTQYNNLMMTIAYLKKNIPVEVLADTIIFTGFTSGKWTPDLGMLMKGPVLHMLIGIGARAGVKKCPIFYKDRSIDKQLEGLESIDFSKMDSPYPSEQPQSQPQAPAAKGFM